MRALLVLLVACSSSPSGLDRAIESHLTIDHGIYGQLSLVSDAGDAPDAALALGDVQLVSNGAIVGETTSDAAGFYELAVAPGAYRLCMLGNTSGDYCSDVTVTDLNRQDWVQYYGAASFCAGECR